MDSENWFSHALASPSASGVNTPTRSSTPTTRTRRAGGNRGTMIDQGLLNESVSLGKRYGEEWGQGGGGKKVVVSNAAGSPVGSPVNMSTSGATTTSQSVGGGGSSGSPSSGGIMKSSLYNVTADQLALHRSSSPASPYTPYRRAHRLTNSSLRGSTSMRGLHKVGSPNTPSLTTSGGFSSNARSPIDTKAVMISPSTVDDDAPPVASYFGGAGLSGSPGGRGEGLGGSSYSGGGDVQRRRTPLGGEANVSFDRSKSTATLLIIGVPYHLLPQLEPFLSQYGSIASFTPGPTDSNFATVTFVDPVVAMRLARKNGEIRWGGCLLGIVPQYGDIPGGSSSSQPGSNAMTSTRNEIVSQPNPSSFGTRSDLESISQPLVPIDKPNVYKPRSDPKEQKNAVVPPEFGFGDAVEQKVQVENSWAGGWLSRVGEIFFGR